MNFIPHEVFFKDYLKHPVAICDGGFFVSILEPMARMYAFLKKSDIEATLHQNLYSGYAGSAAFLSQYKTLCFDSLAPRVADVERIAGGFDKKNLELVIVGTREALELTERLKTKYGVAPRVLGVFFSAIEAEKGPLFFDPEQGIPEHFS